MGSSGYTVRDTLLMFTAVTAGFLIVMFIATNQPIYAVLILVGLIIPTTFVAFEYRKNFRQFQCNNCNQTFTVSYLRLVFTAKFRGTDPIPAGTAAYDLKCPNCNERDWLIPEI